MKPHTSHPRIWYSPGDHQRRPVLSRPCFERSAAPRRGPRISITSLVPPPRTPGAPPPGVSLYVATGVSPGWRHCGAHPAPYNESRAAGVARFGPSARTTVQARRWDHGLRDDHQALPRREAAGRRAQQSRELAHRLHRDRPGRDRAGTAFCTKSSAITARWPWAWPAAPRP